jgi:hypothetical protein
MTVVALLAFVMAVPATITSGDDPDLTATLSLAGRFSVAHACPVSPEWALTAAHVLDPRPFEPKAPLVPYRFESYRGEEGLAQPQSVLASSDLGWLHLNVKVSKFYTYGPKPVKGDKVYWVNLKTNRDNFHEMDVVDAEVVNVVAGLIFTKGTEPKPGASGGCLLNVDGELVGIVSGVWTNEDYRRVGDFVGVFAPWTPETPKV